MPSPLLSKKALTCSLVDDRVLVPERVVGRHVTFAGWRRLGRGFAVVQNSSSRSRCSVRTRRAGGRRAPACPGVELDVVARALPQVARVRAGRAPGRARRIDAERASGSSTQPDWRWCGSRFTTTRMMLSRSASSCCSRSAARCRRVEAQAPVATAAPGSRGGSGSPARSARAGCRPVQIPVADLVLLGVEILLAARLARLVSHSSKAGP
jgi:hypothetical protein